MPQEWLTDGASPSRTLPMTWVHMCKVAKVSFHSLTGGKRGHASEDSAVRSSRCAFMPSLHAQGERARQADESIRQARCPDLTTSFTFTARRDARELGRRNDPRG